MTPADSAGAPPLPDPGARTAWQLALVIAAVVLFALLPAVGLSRFHLNVLMLAFLNGTLAAGLVVSLGYAGLLNISQGTFYGIGAYTTAVLVTNHAVPFEAALVAATAAGALGGLVLGLASLRVRGDYFALVSLALTVAAVQVMNNWPAVTRGREGFFGIPELSLFGFPINDAVSGYYAALVLLVVVYVFLHRMLGTFAGRAMLATQYDEVASQIMGISLPYTKLLAMAVSSGVAGLAGGFLVATLRLITPNDFGLVASFNITLWVIIGGLTSLPGAVLAAGGLTVLAEQFRQLSHIRVGLLGVVVILAVFFRGGVIRDWYQQARTR